MAARKTQNFLPQVFQTDTNKKFLSATVDQLVSEPDLTTLYGYVGRTFAPTFKSGDSYVIESTPDRQNYQLEPSIVIKDDQNNVTFFASYLDVIDKIKYYGGLVNDHSRLFEQEYYSFDPRISYDKLVNFSQYYWLPNGPDSVLVDTTGVELNLTYSVTRDIANNRYIFTSHNGIVDNSIILARGGIYKFEVNQPGIPFWIQTETGTDGVVSATPTVSSRDILGVENNGIDVGTITFYVPQTTAQDRFIAMQIVAEVAYATPIPYSALQNKTLNEFLAAYPQYGGITGQLNGKELIFINSSAYDNLGDGAWTNSTVYNDDGDIIPGFDVGYVVPDSKRFNVWKVVYVDIGQKLTLDTPISANILAGTSLTVGSQTTTLSYDAVAGQEYVYVPNTFTVSINDTITRTAVVTSLSSTASGTNYITVTSTTGLLAGMPIVFVGAPAVGGIISGTNYYIKQIIDSKTITISSSVGGSVFSVSTDTGIMAVTASYTDIPIGTKVTSITKGDPLIQLIQTKTVKVDEKVYIRYGVLNANKEYYKDYDGFLKAMPVISSILDTLWLQDGESNTLYQRVQVVEYNGWTIDVEMDIIGQQNYTSPNGVEFTSGLKIQFGQDVAPTSYQNNQYYVEQVGDVGGGIRLVPVAEMVTPEAYNTELTTNYPGEIFPDYITINRASKDRNAWSRNNRWFHVDVITATATYNGVQPSFSQNARGQRPIVQFETDLQLLNYGRIGKYPIHILDTITTNAFADLQGKIYSTAFGITLEDGIRVIFAADQDPLVKDKIYVINLVQYSVDSDGLPSGPYHINLVLADDGDIQPYNSVVVEQGQYAGSAWWYDGVQWNASQQKTALQQPPLFDVLDVTGKSISTYTRSTFAGTQIFGYLRAATGVTDSVLSRGIIPTIYDASGTPVTNFYLSYKNFQAQGDINFQNFFNTETFSFVDDLGNIITKKVNLGFLQKIQDANTLVPKNTWQTVPENSRQYQQISYIYDGTNNPFTIDILPNTSASIPFLKVFQNYTYLSDQSSWSIDGYKITVNTTLTVGDQIDILIYSSEISKLGFYQVPQNLDLNAQNIDIDTLTLGQLRNHLVALAQNSTIVTGNVLGQSNLRDVDIKQQGGTILQHSSPVPYSGLFLIDRQANFINSMRFAQKEYTRFKNKFLELSTSLNGIDPNDPAKSVDLILTKINSFKNSSFPWYYSDMVPYGPLKQTLTYTVFDPLQLNYEITQIFNDQQLSNTSVLVYLNGIQLAKGIDYSFSTNTPSINFTSELTLNDVITIFEYSNTDGNYIPESPSKLGLWPIYIPEIFLDNTYRDPTNVIRGHDGSITPVFGDYRDNFLIELELRIYNNIKLPSNSTFGDIFSVVPGKFRSSDFTIDEINQLASVDFLNWIGNNKLDFSSNTTFDPNDPFTWNYASSTDKIDGSNLQGSWRACYQYFYDTIRPHITPWEMLGFATQPDWWKAYYGPGPYTGGNKLLWDDLERGFIAYGDRYGVDPHYARPGLSQIIPVDENGNLLSPAQVLSKNFNSKRSAASWAVGQYGPVEFAWRTSSEFPYAAQQALALSKPAKYFGSLIDTYNYTPLNSLYTLQDTATDGITGTEQYLTLPTITNHHITQDVINFNGNSSSGTVYRGAGYLNWIADYLINQGITPSNYITPMLKNFQVNLGYKVSGFTGHDYLEVLAEQVSPTSTNASVLVPNENYKVYLNEYPVPIGKLVYSAVIVEKTNNGYSVRGYDLFNSFFTIIPSVVNSNATKITVLGSSATIFNNYQNLKLKVPYGYEFTSQQQLADFLISYERYLIAQGFTFTDIDPLLNELRNFKLSVKEFLTWAQQGWKSGSIIVLSPVSETINAISVNAITAGIEDNQYGSKILDQNFNLIKNNNYSVMRTPNTFKLSLSESASVLGYVEVDLVQYEHALIFDNTTVFNDVIYQPESGNRQYRLKLIGQKTAGWDGSLNPAGFIYSSGVVKDWQQGVDYLQGDLVQYKNQYYTALQDVVASSKFEFQYWQQIDITQIQSGLLPNFSTLAVASKSYYDSYGLVKDVPQMQYSHSLIGYKPRQYLADLGLTETTQIEFYKGFIKQKGTANAVNQMLKATFNNLSSDIKFYEEWAMRVGEYGALDSNPFIEIPLDEKAFGVNPSVARLVSAADNNLADGVTTFNQQQLYKSYGTFTGNIALNRTAHSNYDNDIPTAGYVNRDDVDLTIYDLANYVDLDNNIANMGSGYTIWCAKDFTQNWNVYRVTETNNSVTQVANALNGYITFTTKTPHQLVAGSIFLVKDFLTAYDGFYRVYKVMDLNTIMVVYNGSTANLTTLTGAGILFRMDSMRFKYMEDSRIYGLLNPPNGWKVGDKIWIDDDAATNAVQGQPYGTQPSGTWKVYTKQHPWSYSQQLLKGSSEYIADDGYGSSVKMSADGLIVAVGSPYYNTNGSVNIFLKNYAGQFLESFNIIPSGANTRTFGSTVDLATTAASSTILAVGAPISYGNVANSNIGYVYTYNKTVSSSSFNRGQVLVGQPGDLFGTSIAFNQDGSWLYIGAPGNNTMYAYGLNKFIPINDQLFSVRDKYTLVLNSTPNTTITAGDIITQAATGARAIVRTVNSQQVLVLDNITNFVYDANVIVGNANVSAVISVTSGSYLTVSNVYPLSSNSVSVTSSLTITEFTPAVTGAVGDPSSLLITNGTTTFIPNVDYKLSNNTITFNVPIPQSDVSVVQQPYYQQVATLPIPTGNSWSQYGYALSSSFGGEQVAVGAPGDTVMGAGNILLGGAGAVYVWDRVIEAFNSVTNAVPGTAGQDYRTANPIASVYKVTLDNVEVTNYTVIASNTITGVRDTIRFNDPPAIGHVIYIEVNKFNLLERLVGIDSLTGGLGAIQANAQFGTSLTICSNNCAIYVGAPGYDNGTEYNSGAVWKFHNRGRLYGTNTGYAINPTFTPGDTIRLNDFEVTVTGTTLDSLVNDINGSKILGVSAANVAGKLGLNSDIKVAKDQLRIVSGVRQSGSSGVYAAADLRIFAFMQIIVNPYGAPGEYFGNKVKLASNAYMLVIGSRRGTTKEFTTFDVSTTALGTRFDATSTRWFEKIPGSGSVYVYELYDDPRNQVEHPGRYAFAQQLDPGSLVAGSQFGYSLDIEGTFITVSGPGATVAGEPAKTGTVYIFQNPTMARGWGLIRYQQPKVDVDSMSRLYLYSNQSNQILTNLQFLDPAKGRILGQAEQEITFKSEYDPAIYNKGFNPAADINTDVFWGDLQVGKVWWDLATVRFVDYEQDTLTYRSLYWGQLFPGSTIEVLEWVKSYYLPSQYVASGGNGIPKYADDSAYVEEIYVDPVTNIITTQYYYWVMNKTTVDPNDETRNIPISTVADYISNPKNQGISYAAMIRSDAIAFYNVSDYLSADNTIMHLDHQLLINTDIIHSEYQLVQKGNANDPIPTKIANKLIDSLSGIDTNGATVPDPTLSLADRYGIEIRPRQSMFEDRLQAVNQMVAYVNSILAVNPVVEQFSLVGMHAEEPIPNIKLGEYDQSVATEIELQYIDTTVLSSGYKVLVLNDTAQNGLWVLYELMNDQTWNINKIQSYKTSLYWHYIDWYADGYSASTKPTFSVTTTVDALKLKPFAGTIIYISNATGNNTWQLVVANADGTLSVVGIQNGTIQLNSNLGDFAGNGLGFSNQDFDSNRFDQNPNNEIRAIVESLQNDIFINTLQGEFNNLFFVMVNYLLTEQTYVDWLFKSSFISVTHKLRTLSQFPSYVIDNQTYYQDYIDEVKPYRTKIREYLIDYTGNDTFGGDISDFDLPAYYDTSTGYGIFRSPSGEAPYTTQDDATWQTFPYNQWYNNRNLQVDSIRIENAGAGYTTPPIVTIVNTDGSGSGATAEAIINGNTGSVTSIVVTNPGSNYVTTPLVVINGSTIGNVNVVGNTVVNSASFTYNLRSVLGLFVGMTANTAFAANAEITSIDRANLTITMTDGNISAFSNTAISFGYPGLDAGVSATAYPVMKNPQIRSFDTKIKFDRTTYNSAVQQWQSNTAYTAGQIITYAQPDGNVMIRKSYLVTANATSGTTFLASDYEIYAANAFTNASDRVVGYYQPTSIMPVVDVVQVSVTLANAAINSNVIYVYPTSITKGMYIGNLGVHSGYITEIASNIQLMVDSVGTMGTVIGNITSGSSIITGVIGDISKIMAAHASNVGYVPGDYISGTGIPFETFVTANAFANSISLSTPAIRSANLAVITYGGIPIKVMQVTLSVNVSLNTDDTITARYDSLDQLIPGVGPLAIPVTSAPFSITPLFGRAWDLNSYDGVQYSSDGIPLLSSSAYDTALYSLYTDTLGTAPEDIITSGGAYIDPAHSRAPEELVPGIMFDTLDMRVYTKINSDANVIAYRVFNNMVDQPNYLRIDDAHTTTLSANLSLTDGNIYVANAAVLSAPNISTVTPGVIFINGERITYYTVDLVNNVLGQIRRGTQGTGSANLILSGTKVFDGSQGQVLPGTLSNVWSSTFTATSGQTAFVLFTDPAQRFQIGSETSIREKLSVTVNGALQPRTAYTEVVNDVETTTYTGSNGAPITTTVSYGNTIIFNIGLSVGSTVVAEVSIGSERDWYNSGSGTAVDGSGFTGSTTDAVKFMKLSTATTP